jgi:predicted nucleic acid-binding protein
VVETSPEVFVDTSGWASGFVHSQPFYPQASDLIRGWRQSGTLIVTTNYVLAELVSLFTRPIRLPRSRQVEVIGSLRSVAWIEIVHVDRTLDDEAWSLLKARLDKEWSLVDCASFVLMQRRGITEALTTDHHFEQAGFVRLLR